MPTNLEKVIKVTKSQYATLAAGGTVGSYTGLSDEYLYLVDDNTEYVDTSTAQNIGGNKSFTGSVTVGGNRVLTLSDKVTVYYGTSSTKSSNTLTTQNLTFGFASGVLYVWPSH